MKREDLEEKAEQALKYLHSNAVEHGRLRAQSDYMASYAKTVLAKCKGKHAGMSMTAAEAQAQCDPEYLSVLQAQHEADEQWYAALFLREAAQAHIAAFQTMSANERAFA